MGRLSIEQLQEQVYNINLLPAHVVEKIEICPFYGCWILDSHVSNKGYSRLWCWNIRFLGHRFTYDFFVRPLGKANGLELDHLCRNTLCVNPNHLEPVTGLENIKRRDNPLKITGDRNHERR